MGFFDKLFGVEKLEKKIKKDISQIEQNLKTSWNWINYLHELEQENRKKINHLIEENNQLKELVKNKGPVIMPEIRAKTPVKAEKKHVPERKAKKDSAIKLKEMDIRGIGKKEAFILQILYQLACFDSSSSISTTKIHENLPYNITQRGLRKKLTKLMEQGIINSIPYGNRKRWFLDMSKLNKLKQFLSLKSSGT